ncbi:ABC-type antimicrobial peptide transport system, permease component [Filimonas lacunae]|uniref:ABC-type antimicrobial peptide transport system, permease component n=1 Tax=Filimonas lacunae TaxID=477680 RepID=A0A173MR43_9BACT|nr:ABC transporter permease [Filimonas lacunae]BAV10124.1 ABC transporter, permease protein [Filimonas lacunae]SIT19063.1 ABC-type antimicrobial peptide transport system, permease component [Filimonas lacunae]
MTGNITIAFRHLKKNLFFSVINISGLAVGLTCFILLALWIQHEVSFDRFYKKSNRLYMAWSRDSYQGQINCWSGTSSLVGPALLAEYPEVAATTRFDAHNNMLLRWQNQSLQMSGAYADPGFLTMFEFPLLAGNTQSLNDPHSIILTETSAKKLFGNKDPLNEVIQLEGKEVVKVTGILKTLPDNTMFDGFDFLLPFSYLTVTGQEKNFAFWGNYSFNTFVELKPDASLTAFNNKVKPLVIQKSKKEEDAETFLYPLSEYRLNSRFENGQPAGGRQQLVNLFGIISVFILLVACINFMNLSTARSEKRAREVGVRKAIGASRFSLIQQFLGESLLIAFISFAVALGLSILLLPAFNQLTGKELFIDFSNVYWWGCALLVIGVTGCIAGSYPAFYLSAFQSVKVLKGTIRAGWAAVLPRKILVVFQFVFSVVLIIATVIVYQQIEHARNRPAGYDKNNVIYASLNKNTSTHFDAIKQELLASGSASFVCKTSGAITQANSNSWGLSWQGKDPNSKVIFDCLCTTGDFIETFDIPLAQGRSINSSLYPSDTTACLLSESAVKAMNFTRPLGQLINKDYVNWKVVGVFKDFIWGSPYEAVRPMFVMGENQANYINIKLNPNKSASANIAAITSLIKKYDPEYPFSYRFVDKAYDYKFAAEKLTGTLARLFAGLTIFISCLGLLGLTAFSAEQRTKEISIRKVLGANMQHIVSLLSKEFVWLTVIALAIASPIAWFCMNSWLSSFSYRISISAWVFAVAGIIIITITLLTVGLQAIKAVVATPARHLRNT